MRCLIWPKPGRRLRLQVQVWQRQRGCLLLVRVQLRQITLLEQPPLALQLQKD